MQHDELQPDEIGALSVFLKAGFGAERSFIFDEDVLRWKYFGRSDVDRSRSLVVHNADGSIGAHVGVTYARFALDGNSEDVLRGMFPTDWISRIPGAGVKLAQYGMQNTDILYALGGTQDAVRALRAMRCRWMYDIPRWRRILSWRGALHGAFTEGGGVVWKSARAVRNAMFLRGFPPVDRKRLDLERMDGFDEAELRRLAPVGPGFTVRTPERLNHLLAHPRGIVTGWRFISHNGPCGYAVLSVIPGAVVLARIVDCALARDDPDEWRHAFGLLTLQLSRMGVDVVTCLARPDCWQQALQSNDYHPYGRCPLHMYQSGSRNAAVDDLMLTMLEGDHAYC